MDGRTEIKMKIIDSLTDIIKTWICQKYQCSHVSETVRISQTEKKCDVEYLIKK